jgi:RNA polymerase sigma factor (sigma-70 family)
VLRSNTIEAEATTAARLRSLERLSPERRALVERHMPLAERIARWRCWSTESLDDVQADAYYGLVRAGYRYRPERGPFSAIARASIEGQISRERQVRLGARRQSWERHEWVAPVSLDVLDAARLGGPRSDVDRAMLLGLREEYERLDGRERTVLWLRFWEGKTQDKVAVRIGVSQMHVSRIERAAVATLGRALWPEGWSAAVSRPTPR